EHPPPTTMSFSRSRLSREFPRDQEELSSVEQLRDYLGEPAFRWLCACAIYPELHWDLTLHLGSLPIMDEDLISEANLLRLIRLPWFRTGVIPEELRGRLIQQTSPADQRAIRKAIVDLLESNPAPEESFAGADRKLEIAFNRSWLNRR